MVLLLIAREKNNRFYLIAHVSHFNPLQSSANGFAESKGLIKLHDAD